MVVKKNKEDEVLWDLWIKHALMAGTVDDFVDSCEKHYLISRKTVTDFIEKNGGLKLMKAKSRVESIIAMVVKENANG